MTKIRIGDIKDTILFGDSMFRTLRGVEPLCNGTGNPILVTGGNSATFMVTVGEDSFALKCYTSSEPLRGELHKVVERLPKELIISPKFLPAELWVGGQFIDASLSPWEEGHTLGCKITGASRRGHSAEYVPLFREFLRLATELHNSEWRHGDLKPDNIIVDTSGKMKLVDCDNIIHPSLPPRPTRGTPHYIHPRRGEVADIHADDYATALIITSIAALIAKPSLFAGEPMVAMPSEGNREIISRLLASSAPLTALHDSLYSEEYKISNLSNLLQCITHPSLEPTKGLLCYSSTNRVRWPKR